MSDALNKSLDDVIKERKKVAGKDKGNKNGPKKVGNKRGIKKPTRGRPVNKDRRDTGNRGQARNTTKRTPQKPDIKKRFLRRTRAPANGRPKQQQNQEKPEKPTEKRCLRVSNLDFNITHKDLMELFSKFGGVTKNRIDYDDLGRSKGSAIIEYEKTESANRAIEEYNGATLDGKTLTVEFDVKPARKVPSVRRKPISKNKEYQRRDDRRDNRGGDRRDNRRDNRRGDRGGDRRDDRGGDRRDDRDRGNFNKRRGQQRNLRRNNNRNEKRGGGGDNRKKNFGKKE